MTNFSLVNSLVNLYLPLLLKQEQFAKIWCNITSTREYVSIFSVTAKFAYIIVRKEINALLFIYFFMSCKLRIVLIHYYEWKPKHGNVHWTHKVPYPSNMKIEKFVLSKWLLLIITIINNDHYIQSLYFINYVYQYHTWVIIKWLISTVFKTLCLQTCQIWKNVCV